MHLSKGSLGALRRENRHGTKKKVKVEPNLVQRRDPWEKEGKHASRFPPSKGPPGIRYPRHLASQVLFTPSPHSYLFVNLCKLFQVVLKKGNLLLLGVNPPTVLGLHFCTLIKDRGKDVRPNRSHPAQATPAHRRPKGWRTGEQEETMGARKSPRGWHSLS